MSPEIENDAAWLKQVAPQHSGGAWEKRRSAIGVSVDSDDEEELFGFGGDGTDSSARKEQSKQTLSRHSPVKLHNRVAALGLPEGGWSGGSPNASSSPGSAGVYGFGDQSPWR